MLSGGSFLSHCQQVETPLSKQLLMIQSSPIGQPATSYGHFAKSSFRQEFAQQDLQYHFNKENPQ